MRPSPVLPQHPGLDSYCELADSLHFLGCDHIVSFLRLGQDLPFMVVDGVWIRSKGSWWDFVDASYLENVRLSWHLDRDPRRRAMADYVIDVVERALAENTLALRPLALFQIWKLLRASGEEASPERLRADALALGIVEDEVDLLVAGMMAAREGPDPELVEAAIRARWSKKLRAAARFADLLAPVATDETLRAFLGAIRADSSRLDATLTEAADLEQTGQLEAAAACYLRAAVLVSDEPEIEAGLERCPPPPPQHLRADIRGDQVELRWTSACSAVGVLSYRVVRVSATGRVLLCEVPDGRNAQAADATPPLGEEISYQVTTVRDGQVESAATASPLVRVVPDVEDLTVSSDRYGVAGSWRMPKRALAVRVLRTEARPGHGPGQEIVVGADGTRFRDRNVLGDRSYQYQVLCGYRPSSGKLIWSAGRAATVDVFRWPQPVTDLHATVTAGGDGVTLRWGSPGTGSVAVLDMSSEVPAPETDLSAAAVGSLGTVRWQAQTGASGSDMRCDVSLPRRGLRHLAMITVLDDRAVTGAAVTADVLDCVHHAICQRSGTTVQVRWVWPLGLTQVMVRWSYPGEPPGDSHVLRVTRDRYRNRLVEIPAHDSGCTITVTPLSTVPDCVSVGKPAIIHVDPQYEISYELRRGRRRSGSIRSVGLRISGKAPTSPTFTLIARPGLIRPTRIDQGDSVLKVNVADIPAAGLMECPVGPRAVPLPCYLLGFVTGPGSENFRLAHPDRSQLLMER